ncbi:diacylglycerol acyltransferase-domain-containing protein [Zopfochytrium polystomum]|nr:diacylglycerol acyltransferase-domain-containing protein [Zopfochytrium polystomum]
MAAPPPPPPPSSSSSSSSSATLSSPSDSDCDSSVSAATLPMPPPMMPLLDERRLSSSSSVASSSSSTTAIVDADLAAAAEPDGFVADATQKEDDEAESVSNTPAAGCTIVPPLGHPHPEDPILQSSVVLFWWSVSITLIVVFPILAIIGLIWAPATTLTLLGTYCAWLLLVDARSAQERGWGITPFGHWFYNLPIWNHFRNYFKARVVKTAELPPDQNYIMCGHPHGVYLLGVFANITSNAKVIPKLFPGIEFTGSTLPVNFNIPIWREFILSIGMVPVDRKSLESHLGGHTRRESRSKTHDSDNSHHKPHHASRRTGKAVFIFIGGAEEYALMARGTLDLVVKKRKGFARLALTTGAALVPVITFGENDLYERVDTPFVRKVSAFTLKVAKFAFPAFKGRFGLLPHRVELVTVVGAPLKVGKVEKPTEEQVEELHNQYLKELTKLYDAHKDTFFKNRVRDMQFAA